MKPTHGQCCQSVIISGLGQGRGPQAGPCLGRAHLPRGKMSHSKTQDKNQRDSKGWCFPCMRPTEIQLPTSHIVSHACLPGVIPECTTRARSDPGQQAGASKSPSGLKFSVRLEPRAAGKRWAFKSRDMVSQCPATQTNDSMDLSPGLGY